MLIKKPLEVILEIQRLLAASYKIVVVENNENNQYFSVSKFEPASGGSDPVLYNYLEGIDITGFIVKGITPDDKGFLTLFEAYIERNNIIKYKFQKDIRWHWFTP